MDFEFSLSELNIDTSEAEGIAIVGMALQIGAAANEEEFWQMLCRGEDMIGDFPEERKTEVAPFRECLYGKAPYVQRAYLPQISRFDAEYFRLTPLEAQMMDPEQRLFLESAFACLQNAGYETAIHGSRTGVYVGHSSPDVRYEQLIDMGMGDTDYAAGVKISGNVESMIAARVSYLLDLQGPAMVINTACSSSLSALHLACNAIRSGEIDAAIVGAVKVYLLPGTMANGNAGVQIASATGRTKTFDAQADGTGGGEGVITVLLKPLSLALADGDAIRAVIRGSSLNQDGASMGITAPNPEAQARLLRECWRESGIEPEEISYIEAHGTGTKLGDPIELEAITKAFADHTAKRQFCAIGSVKSNIGHLDCAAGLAGVAKTVLMLEKGKIPPTLHFQSPNSQIDFIHSPVYVCDKLEAWQPPQGRKCGVSSFGISGTNAHVVLEEAPLEDYSDEHEGAQLLLISGRTEACLLENWRRLREFARMERPGLRELCCSAAVGRAHHAWRAALVLESLEQFLATEPNADAVVGLAKVSATAQPIVTADLHALAQGYLRGEAYRWAELYQGAKKCALPPYAFAHSTYWVEHHSLQAPMQAQKLAPCLDEQIELADGSHVFRYRLSAAQCWELREHTLEGTHILPGTVYIEMLLEAGRCLFAQDFCLHDVMFLSSYACKADDVAELQVFAQPGDEGFTLSIRSKKQGAHTWESHAEGVLLPSRKPQPQATAISGLLAQAGEPQTVERQNQSPIKISPRWLSLEKLWKTDETMTAHFVLQEQFRNSLQGYEAYPSLLDGAVNAANILHSAGFCLPFSYKTVRFFRTLPASFYSRARAYAENKMQQKLFTYDVTLYTDSGEVIAQIEGYTLKIVEQMSDVLHEKRYHCLQWTEKPAVSADAPKKLLLLCAPGQAELPLWKEISRQVQTELWVYDGKWENRSLPQGVEQILFCPGYCPTETEDVSLYRCLYEFLQQTGSLPVGCGFTILTAYGAPVEERVLATHTGLLGMGKSLRKEWPQIRAIDADESLTAQELLSELKQSEYCAAWRNEKRYVEKMLPYQAESASVSFANEGTYVITGGFGGMGATFCEALHRECPDAHIALLQRRRNTHALPENVHAYCVDIADKQQTEACFAQIRRELPPIRGILHTAGVAGGQFLATGTWDAFEKVLRPKLQGTWNLLHCTQNESLDFFVLCSSMSAVFGATGQSEYTAANAFLDGLAHQLRAQGKSAVSVNWSGWKEVGMAVDHGVDPEASAMAFLTPQEGRQALYAAIAADVPQILVGTVKGQLTADTLDLSAYQSENKATAAPVTQNITVMGKGGAPLTQTEQRVAEAWAQTLGLQEVQLHEAFFDAGGSSLLISYLFKKLDEIYPGAIDITGLFVHETVADIAAYIDSRLTPGEEAPLEQMEQDVETLVGQFVSGELSEAELEALLETLS